jgi:hypothetical protein
MSSLSKVVAEFIDEHEIDKENFDVDLMNLVNKVFEIFIKINMNTVIPENEPKAKTQKVLKADKIEDPASVQTRAELNNCTTGILNQFCKENSLKVGGNKTEIMDRVWRFIQGTGSDEDLSSRNKPKTPKKKSEIHECSGFNAKGTPCGVSGNEPFDGHWFCWRHHADAARFIEAKQSDTAFLKAAQEPLVKEPEIAPVAVKPVVKRKPKAAKTLAQIPAQELNTDSD